jgi:hypothetical protein
VRHLEELEAERAEHPTLFTQVPGETVWKLRISTLLGSHECSKRGQGALFAALSGIIYTGSRAF